jgi:hypothetical protein
MRLNPYPRGPVRPAQYLFGRSAQLRSLERFAHDVKVGQRSDVICFLAPPGLGKTCLLKHTKKLLQSQGWLCGYSEASADPDTAIIDLLTDASDALPTEGIGAKFRSRLQEFSITAGPVGFGMKLGTSGDATIYSKFAKLLESLGETAQRARKGVVLMVDEAHVLPRRNLELLLRTVNHLDEFPIGVIIAGLPGIPSKIIYGHEDESTPMDLWYEPLYPLGWNDAELALKTPSAEFGDQFQDDALDSLVEFAHGHPLTLQMVGSVAWLEASRSTPNDDPMIINSFHAEAAINSVRSQLTTSIYSPLWGKLREHEKAVLRSLANCEAAGLTLPYEKPREKETAIEEHLQSSFTIFRKKNEAIDNAHKDGGDILSELAYRGIIYCSVSAAHGSLLEFVVPGFADFITLNEPSHPG